MSSLEEILESLKSCELNAFTDWENARRYMHELAKRTKEIQKLEECENVVKILLEYMTKLLAKIETLEKAKNHGSL